MEIENRGNRGKWAFLGLSTYSSFESLVTFRYYSSSQRKWRKNITSQRLIFSSFYIRHTSWDLFRWVISFIVPSRKLFKTVYGLRRKNSEPDNYFKNVFHCTWSFSSRQLRHKFISLSSIRVLSKINWWSLHST